MASGKVASGNVASGTVASGTDASGGVTQEQPVVGSPPLPTQVDATQPGAGGVQIASLKVGLQAPAAEQAAPVQLNASAAQSVLCRHCTQSRLVGLQKGVPGVAAAQLALLRQPTAQALPAVQYWLAAQPVWVAGSQSMQLAPAGAHTSFGATHALAPPGRQTTQLPLRHAGVEPPHSLSAAHARHCPVAILQMGMASLHCALLVHWTQRPAVGVPAGEHTEPVGHSLPVVLHARHVLLA